LNGEARTARAKQNSPINSITASYSDEVFGTHNHQPDQARPGERHDKRSNPAVRALDGYRDRIEACGPRSAGHALI
jgi:hypothetical protein